MVCCTVGRLKYDSICVLNQDIYIIIFVLNVHQIINNNLNLTTENYLRQMATGYSETAGPEVLRVVHIFGPLVMLAIGVLAASLAFAGEHIYYRVQLRKERDQMFACESVFTVELEV